MSGCGNGLLIVVSALSAVVISVVTVLGTGRCGGRNVGCAVSRCGDFNVGCMVASCAVFVAFPSYLGTCGRLLSNVNDIVIKSGDNLFLVIVGNVESVSAQASVLGTAYSLEYLPFAKDYDVGILVTALVRLFPAIAKIGIRLGISEPILCPFEQRPRLFEKLCEYVFKSIASAESVASNVAYSVGNDYYRNLYAKIERAVSDFFKADAENYGIKRGASLKRRVAYFGNAIGDYYLFKRCASLECGSAYIRNFIGNGNLIKTLASLECRVTDGCYVL